MGSQKRGRQTIIRLLVTVSPTVATERKPAQGELRVITHMGSVGVEMCELFRRTWDSVHAQPSLGTPQTPPKINPINSTDFASTMIRSRSDFGGEGSLIRETPSNAIPVAPSTTRTV